MYYQYYSMSYQSLGFMTNWKKTEVKYTEPINHEQYLKSTSIKNALRILLRK